MSPPPEPSVTLPGRRTSLVHINEHLWTEAELLGAIRSQQPRRRSSPDWTFCIGNRPEYIAISTSGPRAFYGQHPLWNQEGQFEGVMFFRDLHASDVRHILPQFYAGRRAEGCFAPYHGEFKFRIPAEEVYRSLLT